MDVALDGSQRDLALIGHVAGGHEVANGIESGACRLGGGHKLGQEELAAVKLIAHLVQSGNEHAVDHVHGVMCGKQVAHQRGHVCLSAAEN